MRKPQALEKGVEGALCALLVPARTASGVPAAMMVAPFRRLCVVDYQGVTRRACLLVACLFTAFCANARTVSALCEGTEVPRDEEPQLQHELTRLLICPMFYASFGGAHAASVGAAVRHVLSRNFKEALFENHGLCSMLVLHVI